ncbi:MAG: hypothetical protein ABSB60_05490 [Terracidiphilus sp.]|jgi:hypothetical protein
MTSTFAPQIGRLDRHVRRSVLRVGEGISRHRVAYSLEEALRLTTLPGEEEGRIYCFRRVSLSGIPAEANRRVWMEQVQQVLGALAAQAVHASDPNAATANAVYFNSVEEALETQLRKAIRAAGGARWSQTEWFANSAIGVGHESNYATQIAAIVERLRPPLMAPGAAASLLFAALGTADPAPLLSAIPTASIREWLRELDEQSSQSTSAPAVDLPGEIKTALQRAASHFGWKDPVTTWLAAQAVLSLSPSTWNSGTALKRARATLRALEDEQDRDPRDRSAIKAHEATALRLFFDDDSETATSDMLLLEEKAATSSVPSEVKPSSVHAKSFEEITFDQAPATQEISSEFAQSSAGFQEIPAAIPPLLGEVTQSAGLCFLLNVLRSLGIVSALEACSALAEAGFATHILRQLATEAGVAGDDPILLCLHMKQQEFVLPDEIFADLVVRPSVWPRGFTVSRRASFDSHYFLRVWTVAAKRWLWRIGRLTLPEVVNRNGRVWLTRTDLDVTFPLAAADLRIRRIGLDIDPGWLPWFSKCGLVVRFHYRDRKPEEPAC